MAGRPLGYHINGKVDPAFSAVSSLSLFPTNGRTHSRVGPSGSNSNMSKLVVMACLLAFVIYVSAEEKSDSTDAMVLFKRFGDYASGFLEKVNFSPRGYDDHDDDGITDLIIGLVIFCIILFCLPILLCLFLLPIGLLLWPLFGGHGSHGSSGLFGTHGLTGTLGTLGNTIPVVNVNEAPGRRKRTAGIGFSNKVARAINDQMKNL